MRRKDREITDFAEIIDVIDRCDVVRLAMTDGKIPYVIPLNFGYMVKDDVVTLYFHGAGEGKKIDMLLQNPNVCVEFDIMHKIYEHEEAAHWTTFYESVIGFGTAELLQDVEEKAAGLDVLMKKYGYQGKPQYPPMMLKNMAVGKITLTELSGKRNLPQ